MSYHIISIDAESSSITAEGGRLISQSPAGSHAIPMEDVAAIIITSFQCTLSSHFLIEAAKQRIGVILCELYRPACIVLPIDRATDTELLRHLAHMPAQLRKRLWQKTVDAKCLNQYELAQSWDPSHPALDKMQQVIHTSKESKEGEVAKLYWSVFSDSHAHGSFSRNQREEGINTLLNYAYAVLLSLVLRYLLALGLDPTFGIFHTPRAHATPLAYDLMEPFRPVFDANIARWLSHRSDISVTDSISLSKDAKRHILSTLLCNVRYQGKEMPLKLAVELSVRSFREAVLSSLVTPYEPWRISIIKWAG